MFQLFTLALALGKTVNELKKGMSWTEFLGWLAFYDREPFGENRKDVRAALAPWAIANQNRGKNDKPIPLEDFILIKHKTKPIPPELPEGWAHMYD